MILPSWVHSAHFWIAPSPLLFCDICRPLRHTAAVYFSNFPLVSCSWFFVSVSLPSFSTSCTRRYLPEALLLPTARACFQFECLSSQLFPVPALCSEDRLSPGLPIHAVLLLSLTFISLSSVSRFSTCFFTSSWRFLRAASTPAISCFSSA